MTLLLAFLLLQAPDAEAVSQQALDAAANGRTGEAEALWKRALAMNPALYSANFNLGLTYFQQGRPAEAAPLLAAAVRQQPKQFQARYLHGAALSRSNRVEAALASWRAALALQPNNDKLLQLLAVEYGKGRYFREAAESASKALTLRGPDPNLFLLAIKAHQDAGEPAKALELASRYLAAFPGHPRAHFEYGFELYRAGRSAEALEQMRKAQTDPSYEEPPYFLGELLLRQGNPKEAVAPLERAIALRRDYIAAWCALARAELQLGRTEAARDVLLKALQVNPRHPQPHLLLSQVYFRLGDEVLAGKHKELSLRFRRLDANAMEPPVSRPFPGN